MTQDKTPDTDDKDVVDTVSAAEVTSPATAEDTTEVPATTDVPAADVAEPDVAEPDVEEAESDTPETAVAADKPGVNWPRVLAFGVLPALALLLGATAGFLKWQDSSVRSSDYVRIESVQIAKDATVQLLSYKPDTVEQDLGSARDLLTGEFRESYTQLINDVVIPGSKEKLISAEATVPAVASVSAEPNKAVVLVFVNQTVVVGADAPTATTSSVQVTMDRVGDRWLISEFNPV